MSILIQHATILAMGGPHGSTPFQGDVLSEGDSIRDIGTDIPVPAGRTAPRFHGEAHNSIVEREATHRAISLAELVDAPMLIVHVSGAEAIEQIHWAQGRDMKIYAETCPQYPGGYSETEIIMAYGPYCFGPACWQSLPDRD